MDKDPDSAPAADSVEEQGAESEMVTIPEDGPEMGLASEAMPEGGLGDSETFAQVADAFQRLLDVLPGWFVVGLIVFVAVAIGLRFSQRPAPPPAPQEPPPGDRPTVRAALPPPENPAFKKYQEFLEGKGVAAFERALSILERRLGKNYPDVATALNNLALLYKKQGDLESAEPLLKRAMEIKEKHFDPGHPSLVTGQQNYAALLRALGRDEEAEVFERRATVLPPKRTEEAAE